MRQSKNVRLNTDGTQFFDAVLRRLGLQLARCTNKGHQREMHKQRVFAAHILPQLADGFEKRQRLNVAHRAANLDNHHVGIDTHLFDGRLDFVRHVRNDLHGLAQIVAAAFFLNDGFVDADRS